MTTAVAPASSRVGTVGRRRLVDSEALIDALASGQLGGAGLDVVAEEPFIPEALTLSQRVVLTPHSAWSSTESFTENRRKAATAVLRLLRRQPVRDIVNGVAPTDNTTTHIQDN